MNTTPKINIVNPINALNKRNASPPKFNKSVYSITPTLSAFTNNSFNANYGTSQFKIVKKPQTAHKNFKFNSVSGIDIQNINVKYRLYDKAKHSSKGGRYIKTYAFNSYQGTVRYSFK